MEDSPEDVSRPRKNSSRIVKERRTWSSISYPTRQTRPWCFPRRIYLPSQPCTSRTVLIEGCRSCKFDLGTCIITTATLEVWRCESCEISSKCHLGTIQTDLCEGLKIEVERSEDFGSLVQAGMNNLQVVFKDERFPPLQTGFPQCHTKLCLPSVLTCTPGLEQLRRQFPDDDINSTTDQYITRIVDGKLLTERIVRLLNDYPTTEREKASFEAEAAKTSEAMEKLANDLLSNGLSDDQKKNLEDLQKKADASRVADGQTEDLTPQARARFKKEKGNEFFRVGDFHQAAVFYTEAAEFDDKDHTIFANRSACFLKIGQACVLECIWDDSYVVVSLQAAKALADADKCIELNETFVMTLSLLTSLRHAKGAKPIAGKGALSPRSVSHRTRTIRGGAKRQDHSRAPWSWILRYRTSHDASSVSSMVTRWQQNAEAKASLQIAQMKAARARQSQACELAAFA
eukprot:31087-Hanusia_phi.AAC.1